MGGSGGGLRIPGWAVGAIVLVLLSLFGLAAAWGRVESHAQNDSRHVNAELVQWRLRWLEAGMRELLRRSGVDPATIVVPGPGNEEAR